ncbi:MAG: hypothetical protein Q9217_004473 [Psora testacea]
MSEPIASVQDTNAPTTSGPDLAAGGPTTAAENPKSTQTPVLGPGEGHPTDKGAAEAVANVTNIPKEEKVGKGEVLVESHPINEGILNYKGPGLKGLIFSKKYFWLSDAPLEDKHLSAYIGNEKAKDIAHANAAHATQTGKGLLFYAKRAEDKDHPQGILNLVIFLSPSVAYRQDTDSSIQADMTDLAKGNFNDFTVNLHGHKHTFQALSKSERDGWLVAIEPKMADAKTSREGIIGSEGYKTQLEKYGKPGVVAGTTGTSRSLSRPKKTSKSRERVKDATTAKDSTAAKDIKPAASKETTAPISSITTDATTDSINTVPTETHKGTTGEHTAEIAVGATTGAAAGGKGPRKGSTSDEDKKAKKTEKGRSQSRNKRGSIFGGLLAKKEESDDKKAAKKAEKEEKKEEKAEEKAIKHEVKKEEKAEHKAEKQLEREAKHEGAGKTGDFDAPAVASRVMGEPVLPAAGATTGATETTPSPVTEAVITNGPTSTNTPTATTASRPTKRNSVFGGFFGKRDATTSPTTTETSPAVPAKDEPAAVSSNAPQLDNPVRSPATEATTPATAAKSEPTPVTEGAAPTSPTTLTDRRRTSFFSNLGTKKERKAGTTSGDELTDGEGKKQGGGISGLLRKASRVQPRKDANAHATSPAEVPLPKGTATGEKAVTNGESPVKAGEEAEQKPVPAGEEVGPSANSKNEQSTPVGVTA